MEALRKAYATLSEVFVEEVGACPPFKLALQLQGPPMLTASCMPLHALARVREFARVCVFVSRGGKGGG